MSFVVHDNLIRIRIPTYNHPPPGQSIAIDHTSMTTGVEKRQAGAEEQMKLTYPRMHRIYTQSTYVSQSIRAHNIQYNRDAYATGVKK